MRDARYEIRSTGYAVSAFLAATRLLLSNALVHDGIQCFSFRACYTLITCNFLVNHCRLYQVSTRLIRRRMPFFGFAPRLPYLNTQTECQYISQIHCGADVSLKSRVQLTV
jgi:hypothetical protein